MLATLHTNDATTAVSRLANMDAPRYMIASALKAVVAQRLVRVICPDCRQELPEPSREVLAEFPRLAGATIFAGRGCETCRNSGYRGRTGIFELLRITDTLRELIATRPTTEQIIKAAPPDHVSMRHDGVEKVLKGQTTPEEVFRVTQSLVEED